MKRIDFYNLAHFNRWCDDNDEQENVLNVVHHNGWMKADAFVTARSFTTAINKFFRALNPGNYCPELKVWEDTLLESCENGCFNQSDYRLACGEVNPHMSYAFGVEDMDGRFYIFLNLDTGTHI